MGKDGLFHLQWISNNQEKTKNVVPLASLWNGAILVYKYPYIVITSPPRSSLPLEIFNFSCILQEWGKRFCSLTSYYLKCGSDYSLNSNNNVGSLDPAQIEKAVKWQVLNTFARQTDTIFLWSPVPCQDFCLWQSLSNTMLHDMEALEVCREEIVCANWRIVKWQSFQDAYVLAESF